MFAGLEGIADNIKLMSAEVEVARRLLTLTFYWKLCIVA
jgi:hypothetical protein